MRKRKNYEVLTIKQPWAYLSVHGIKDCENRNWIPGKCPKNILIRDGGCDENSLKWIRENQWGIYKKFNKFDDLFERSQKTFGHIIGGCTVDSVGYREDGRWRMETYRYQWKLINPWYLEEPFCFMGGIVASGRGGHNLISVELDPAILCSAVDVGTVPFK